MQICAAIILPGTETTPGQIGGNVRASDDGYEKLIVRTVDTRRCVSGMPYEAAAETRPGGRGRKTDGPCSLTICS
jgi:hypothetical protein